MGSDYLYIQQAEMLKKIGHPVRLCILHELINRGSCQVSELCNILGIPQSTVSQHLGILKIIHVVSYKGAGTIKMYKVCNEDVKKIINILLKENKIISL
ncbi:ArsR/SmtB family transcription factor [Bacillus thuringiensis]|uniref:ArsR/SmtB family transcription factor n=1 Tax=Bacillus thuringiensis TaxID=1428 RepID=UPI00119CD350|nr:metalloregulator ArsR/SmtB family transcription factor [Bacillus thuringiensis]